MEAVEYRKNPGYQFQEDRVRVSDAALRRVWVAHVSEPASGSSVVCGLGREVARGQHAHLSLWSEVANLHYACSSLHVWEAALDCTALDCTAVDFAAQYRASCLCPFSIYGHGDLYTTRTRTG